MADQVVDALVNDGTFRVIERKKLDTVLAEQDFSRSDRADPSAAKLAKVGKVLGVRYIICRLDHQVRHRVALAARCRVKGIGLGGKKAKSEVNLTVRLIDTTTGEILISAKGTASPARAAARRSPRAASASAPTPRSGARAAWARRRRWRATIDLVAQLVAKKDRLE